MDIHFARLALKEIRFRAVGRPAVEKLTYLLVKKRNSYFSYDAVGVQKGDQLARTSGAMRHGGEGLILRGHSFYEKS